MDSEFINKDWEPEFLERLSQSYDELKWLYFELYRNDNQAFHYFIQFLHDYYVERPEYLKNLDRKRLADPAWYKRPDMLGMQMYVGAFAGNLKGVQSHLDYIQDCGVNYIHLMPLLESPMGRSDGGYAVSNFRKVDPALGTMDDLAELARDCHDQNICLCLDFVMNHTSEDHEWAMRAKAGEREFQERYFFYDNWDIPNEFEKTVPQVFPTTAPGNFSWCSQAGKVVMTTFYPYQWDLNYANPVVFNDMTANMLFLYNQGIDVIRLDATPYIWKELGTNCRNLPQVHNLVRMMHIAADVVCPGSLLLGEVVMEPSKVVPYFGSIEKPECQMLYNVTTMASTWHTVATRNVRLLKHQLEAVFALPHDYMFLNYLRCHDDIGWGLDYAFLKQFGVEEVSHKKFLNEYLTGHWYGSDMRGELYNDDPRLGDARLCGTTASLCGIEAAEYEWNEWKLNKAIRLDLMLHAFLLTQSGLPIIYAGDEIGQLNDYSYHENPLKWDDSRYIHRGDFHWNEAELRTDESTRQGKIFQTLKTLENIRKSHKVFDNNADTWLLETYNDHVLGIGRYYEGQKLLALFNFSEGDETAWISEETGYTNLMNGDVCEAKNYGLHGYEFVWLYKSYVEEEEPAPVVEAATIEEKVEEAPAAPAEEKAEEAAPVTTLEPAEEEPVKKPKKATRTKKAKAEDEAAPVEEEKPKKSTRTKKAKAEDEAASAEEEKPKKATRAKKAKDEEKAAPAEEEKPKKAKSSTNSKTKKAEEKEAGSEKPKKSSSKSKEETAKPKSRKKKSEE